MKKFLILFIFGLFVINVTSQKAEAGLAIVTATEAISVGDQFYERAVFGGGAIAFLSSLAFVTGYIQPAVFLPVMIISLDADGSLPRSLLLIEFSKRYPFVDNQMVFNEVINAIKLKYMNNVKDEIIYVNFSADELHNLFSETNLTDDEMGTIINDLI